MAGRSKAVGASRDLTTRCAALWVLLPCQCPPARR
jgi:hypothetical protein